MAEGVVTEWNKANPDKESISPGDYIEAAMIDGSEEEVRSYQLKRVHHLDFSVEGLNRCSILLHLFFCDLL